MSGWFRMERGWRDSDVFASDEPFTEREAWSWLIEKAAWKDCVRRTSKGERINVERGQFHTSLRNLGKVWGWGKWKVNRYLERLTEYDMIRTVTGQSGLLITICNYSKYQDVQDGLSANDRTVTGQSPDTQEENKTNIPSSNEEGASPDAIFWKNAKEYLRPHVKGDPGRLIGKWCKGRTQADVAAALTASQLARAVDPVPYIEATLRREEASEDSFTGFC